MEDKREYKPEICRLKSRLQYPLPGRVAQFEMAPSYRSRMNETGNRLKAGVMLLLYPREERWYFPLIERPEYNGAHSGQISFPGGKFDPSDIDLQATALRECEEEIGIKANKIESLGSLTKLYIPVSKFEVYPTVGVLDHTPVFIPDQEEVKTILEVPLTMIFNQKNIQYKSIEYQQRKETIPYYHIFNREVWGATAMILSEFKQIWEEINGV